MKKILLLVIAMNFCVISSFAGTFYVRTDGSNGNLGNSNTPGGAWKTLRHAVSQLNSGDMLLINDGYYFEPEEVKLENKTGSNSNRIIIKAINPRAVKLESNSIWPALTFMNCTGVTVEGLEITFQANTRSDFFGISILKCNRITVRNCWVHHAPFSGIQANESDNIIVENCLINDNCKGLRIAENGSGISTANSVDRENNSGFHHIFRNNIIYNNEATAAVYSGKPSDGNGIIFDVNNGSGFNYISESLVENNLIYKNGGRGILVFASQNVTIRNNTLFYNNYILDQHGFYNGEIHIEGPGCSIYNNIAVQDPSLTVRSSAIRINASPSPPSQNNLFVGSIYQEIGSNNITYPKGAQANVKFINASTNPSVANFRLQSNSPAIDAGNNLVAAANDLDGRTRPVGGTVDIGSYEYGGSGNVTQETWTNVSGNQIANIPTGTMPNTTATLTSLEIPLNNNDNYGVRIRGYIIPTTTGDYTFYIASDDNGQLKLSTDNSPANERIIASHNEWTGSREWNKFPLTQKSTPKSLNAGQKYYFEALMKEGNGGDNLAIGWTGPGISTITVIGAANLDRYEASTAGANLGFENNFASWTTYGTANINTTAANVRSGSKAGFFSAGGGNYIYTGLTPGATYVVRGWMKAVSGSGNWIVVTNYGGANTGLSSSSTSWTQTGNIIFTMGTSNTTASLATYTDGTSSAYFDDFTLAPYIQPRASAESTLEVLNHESDEMVHPNPASNSFHITVPTDDAEITVTRLDGKVINSVNAVANVTTIDCSNWATGVYIIKIRTGSQTTFKKVSVVK